MPVRIVERLLQEYKRTGFRWIGLEVERLLLNRSGQFIRYKDGLEQIFKILIEQKEWRPDLVVDGHTLGLIKQLSAISLEPGSQFEVSLAPRQTISEIFELEAKLDAEVLGLEELKGARFLEIGVNPWERAEDIPLLPSPRYALMDRYFQAIPHGRGRDMMRLTTGIHINLDYANEQEGIEMMRVAMGLAPYWMAAFANSPIRQKSQGSHLSERQFIWENVDSIRSGIPTFVFQKDFSLSAWARFVSEVPLMYAYDENKKVFDPAGKSLAQLPKALAEINALPALRQIFTQVRFKPCCVEVRCFDQVPTRERAAATAWVVGILYDDEARKQLNQEFLGFDSSEIETLMKEGARLGLRSDRIFSRVPELVAIAKKGLQKRGFNEEKFLEPLEARIVSRKTPADFLLERGGIEP